MSDFSFEETPAAISPSEARRNGMAAISGNDPFASRASVFYVAALFMMATIPTLISPALIEGWQEKYGWSESRLGMLATADLAGLAIGGASALFWQRRWCWRRVTIASLIATILLNVLCSLLNDFYVFLALRLLAGSGAGVLTGIYSAFLANTSQAERFVAATTFFQIAIMGGLLAVSGPFEAQFGLTGIFLFIAAVLVPLVPFARLVPAGWPRGRTIVSAAGAGSDSPTCTWPGLIALAAFIPFDFAFAIYPFLPEFGRRAASLAVDSATNLLGISQFVSMIGPGLAFWVGERFGVIKPLLGSAALCSGFLLYLTADRYSPMVYFAGVSLLQAGLYFLNCYFCAAVIAVDNRLTAATTPVASISNALGTTLMGIAIETGGIPRLTIIALGCIFAASIMSWAALFRVGWRRWGA